jgi:hypothetical protein
MTHNGTDAMISAARLDDTSCSASETRPLPPKSRAAPTIADAPSSRFVMRMAATPLRRASTA